MLERELEQRGALVLLVPRRLTETLEEVDRREDQYQRSICILPFPGHVSVNGTPQLCNRQVLSRVLRRRRSEEWLEDVLREIERAKRLRRDTGAKSMPMGSKVLD